MVWTVEDQTRAFLSQIRDRSARSAFYDLVNHFDLDFLQCLADDRDKVSEIVDRVYASPSDSDDVQRIWIDGAMIMLALIKDRRCRCDILTKGVPASPLNLEKSQHMHNVDAIDFHYGVSVTGRYDCVYCGRSFTVFERPGFSEPEWRPTS
ncbi:hypothetical protein Rcae01_00661 [Novipirellula caenicola]|uniref:Uncharacterized protein n=2 Tax=Novipirellula caenicola TaxID=1536901 RepID=A0ABP9VJ27_9BACT